MLVIQMDSAAWRSSHSTTGRSGTARINAESTFVSITIMAQYLQIAQVDPEAPVDQSSYLYRKSVPQFAIRFWRSGDWMPSPHCEEYAEFPLPYCDHNKIRLALQEDMQSNEVEERNHRADLAVVRRLRAGFLKPDDHLVYVRGYGILGSSAWKIVHESNAAAFIPFGLMRRYGETAERHLGT